jgi:hypothetical protein
MSEEMTSAVALPFRHRVRHGVRHPQNWLQLIRFAAVGASGYVVNLGVFTVCLHLLGIDYRMASSTSETSMAYWNPKATRLTAKKRAPWKNA